MQNSYLSNGIYLLTFKLGNAIYTQKFIKE
ncbi:MAG: T9SS type A sorting domain-containing protein [Bacteroidales bacterium]|jgi:hypothetical protein|nr:T9SS type A sorting domain-containing protein [Bacteroidales bacterium]